ncbi:aminopeptidase P family N-terminal domain-containing protein, partial [Pseudomonas helleri]
MSIQSLNQESVVQRLARTRALMEQNGIYALLVPSADPHLSEYLPAYWQGRQWLSGFHGSVGTLIVTPTFAGLWADSRYWEQAGKELAGSTIELVKLQPGQPGPLDWLAEQAPQGSTVSVDGAVLALASARTLETKLKERGAVLRTDIDVLSLVWADRPALPKQPVYEHLPPQATVSRVDKLAKLRETLKQRNADAHFIATLDDIAWLFNLRGSDVSFNPVFVSFALIEPDRATVFVDLEKVGVELRDTLQRDGVNLRDYTEINSALAALSAKTRLLIDPARVTCGLLNNVNREVTFVESLNPTTFAKSQKSLDDAVHIRQAMEQDGAALCEFFAWLEAALGHERITELTIDEQLSAARARRPGFVSLSFNTIAAFNANGAMPHYHA